MGKIFKDNKPYVSKYYSRKPTEKQLEAAKANLADWQRLKSSYGMEKAKKIAERRRNLKKTMGGHSYDVPKRGTAAQDRFRAIMDSLNDSDRESIRDYYDSNDILEVGTQWLDSDELGEDEYMDAETAEELLNAYERWMIS